MMIKKLLMVILVLSLSYECIAQISEWSFNDGWALRKKPGSSQYEKFFAIGIWGIPGYQFIHGNNTEPPGSFKVFQHFLCTKWDTKKLYE